jgi:hypothetical protein
LATSRNDSFSLAIGRSDTTFSSATSRSDPLRSSATSRSEFIFSSATSCSNITPLSKARSDSSSSAIGRSNIPLNNKALANRKNLYRKDLPLTPINYR